MSVQTILCGAFLSAALITVGTFCAVPVAAARTQAAQHAWVAYWDAPSGLAEQRALGNRLSGISYFAVGFDENGKLLYPEGWNILEADMRANAEAGKDLQRYLTVVNDVRLPDGKSLTKDLNVLHHLLDDERAMDAHIKELIAAAQQKKCSGLEIDYERFWKDETLIKKFEIFVNKLIPAARKAELKVRIDLEPGMPFGRVSWPRDAEYVVMLYNLFGTHSNVPGPKATSFFITRMIRMMNRLPENRGVALATGGCKWPEGKRPSFINEDEAKELQQNFGGQVVRDGASHALHFKYAAATEKGEVWYADAETLRYWRQIARLQGINKFSLWRLGHNVSCEKYFEN